jgi:predicted TIM-barrel fold metal-dependent hydrolase
MNRQMIIDCHMHLKNGDIYRTEHTGKEIVEALDKAGINKGIVFAMCLSSREATEMVYKEVQKYPDRLIGFAYARPCYDSIVADDVRYALTERNMKGVKIHRGETLLHPDVIGPVLEVAIECDVPCLIDSGNDYAAISGIVAQYPQLKLILAHLGSPAGNVTEIDKYIELARNNENVYLDTAYVPTYWKIKDAVERLGPQKVLYGSDGILVDPRTELMKIEVLDFPAEVKEYIYYKNIAKLLKLE